MVEGVSFEHLGTMILERHAQKRDVVVSANEITFVTNNGKNSLSFSVNDSDVLAELSNHALYQLAAWEKIPATYFDRIRSDEHLLSENVNKWLQQSERRRLIRLVDNGGDRLTVRAFVSDRFSVQRDNWQLANHIFPKVRAAGMVVKSCQITDERLYLQVIDENLSAWLKLSSGERVIDDQLYGGFVFSNSEIRKGSTNVEPMIYRPTCTNGMIVGQGLGAITIHKSHKGRQLGDEVTGAYELTPDDYVSDDKFLAELDAALNQVLSPAQFANIIERVQHGIATKLPYEREQIVKVVAKVVGLSSSESDQLTGHLIRDGHANLWDVANGVTRTAQDQPYERAVALQRLGSIVLTLDPDLFADVIIVKD